MITRDELRRLADADEAPEGGLADIQDVQIDASLCIEERLDSFISQLKNPYHFRCGSTPVKISYTGDGKALSQRLTEHFARNRA